MGVGGQGGAGVEGAGLLGMDCLLILKGQVGTVGMKEVDQGVGSRGRVWEGREAPVGTVLGNV